MAKEELTTKEEQQAKAAEEISIKAVLERLEAMEAEEKSIRLELEQAKTEAAKAKKKADAAAEEKKLTEGQKQALLERRFHKAMEEAKQDTVEITLPLNPNGEDDEVFAAVNGYRYLIRRGEPVSVPRFVAEALANSDRQKMAAARHMKKLQEKARK